MAAIQLFFSPHLKCIIYNIEDEVCEESLHFYLDFHPGKKKKIYYCALDVLYTGCTCAHNSGSAQSTAFPYSGFDYTTIINGDKPILKLLIS